MSMPKSFNHEKLTVYQKAIEFNVWVADILEKVPKRLAVHDQLDRATTSIPLNIAEGNGKHTPKDRCRYFDIAQGSALESAAALDISVARRILTEAEVQPGKEMLFEIVSMLVGLIRSTSPDRMYETPAKYGEESLF